MRGVGVPCKIGVWKWMVGRWNFISEKSIFRCCVSFREGITPSFKKDSTTWVSHFCLWLQQESSSRQWFKHIKKKKTRKSGKWADLMSIFFQNRLWKNPSTSHGLHIFKAALAALANSITFGGKASFNSVLSFGFGGTNACATVRAWEFFAWCLFRTVEAQITTNIHQLYAISYHHTTTTTTTTSNTWGLGCQSDDLQRCWNQQGRFVVLGFLGTSFCYLKKTYIYTVYTSDAEA